MLVQSVDGEVNYLRGMSRNSSERVKRRSSVQYIFCRLWVESNIELIV